MDFSLTAACKRLSRLAFFTAAVSAVPVANAAFTIEIDDDLTNTSGVARTTITDGGDGFVNYAGDFGGFDVVVASGTTQPAIADPLLMALDSLEISGEAATLYIWLTSTDLTGPIPGLSAAFSGTTNASVSLDFLYDATNSGAGAAFASGDSVTSSTGTVGNVTSFSGTVSSGGVAPANPYSLTILATVTHTDAQQISQFDAVLTAVPVPAAAWLFGSALLGLGIVRRK